jgi:hypothetical protein
MRLREEEWELLASLGCSVKPWLKKNKQTKKKQKKEVRI